MEGHGSGDKSGLRRRQGGDGDASTQQRARPGLGTKRRRSKPDDAWTTRGAGICIFLSVVSLLAIWGGIEHLARTNGFVAFLMGRPDPEERDDPAEIYGGVLWMAAKVGNKTALQESLGMGAKLGWVHPNEGTTAMMEACFRDDVEFARLLHEAGAPVRSKMQGTEWTVLQGAVDHGALRVTRYLLESTSAKRDINMRDKLGCSPLHNAVFRNDVDMAKLLLDHDADIHLRDLNGAKATHWAAHGGAKAVMKWLLAEAGAGEDLEALNKLKRTPLMSAVLSGNHKLHKDITKFLISHGANVRAKDKKKNTVLHIAAEVADAEMMEYYLLKTAMKNDLQALNKFGKTPRDFAELKGNDKAIKVIDEFAGLGGALHDACAAGDGERVKIALLSGAPVGWVVDGKTAVEVAKASGCDECLRLLADEGSVEV